MPTVAVSTLCDDGTTTIGSYSLVFPYYIAGKNYYAMILECRNSKDSDLSANGNSERRCEICV